MSSHHIVKEKQEPALYIHNLGNFNEELLGQLLEWSPTIIANEQDYEKLVSMGIKVDLISGNTAWTGNQEHTAFIRQTGSGIEEVIDYLLLKAYPAVNIISQGRGLALLRLYSDKLNIVWLNENEKTFGVNNGFNVWKPAGTVFCFDCLDVVTTNLTYMYADKFKVHADGFVSFLFEGNRLFITEQL